jgi:hypothetical protein
MSTAFKHVVLSLCAYEVAAIVTGRIPTLTALQKRYRFIGPLIVGGLFVHFYLDDISVLAREHARAHH